MSQIDKELQRAMSVALDEALIERENQNRHIPGLANRHLPHYATNGVTFNQLKAQFENKGDI